MSDWLDDQEFASAIGMYRFCEEWSEPHDLAARQYCMLMPVLTDTQNRVLVFICQFRATQQVPPTRHEIAKHFGWSSANAAQGVLSALQRKGFVSITPGRSRGIYVLREAL